MKELRHEAKYEKFGAGSVLKNIGDKLAELLYGDGKTLGTTPASGILGKAQTLWLGKHDLLAEPIRVYIPQWCIDEENVERLKGAAQKYTAVDRVDSIKRMIAHAANHGVDIKMVTV